jgi:ribosomal protein S18 acetylase RimI-like enzyme
LNIVLRDRLLPTDREPIERMTAECGFFREEEVQVALSLVDDRLDKGESSDYRFIIALHGEQVVGYCCYGWIACTVHSFDLYWIVVDAAIQRSGIGRRLAAAAEERIREAGGSRVYVETSGQPKYESTRRFYEACGYRLETVLKDFYAPGDDKLTYVKVLG